MPDLKVVSARPVSVSASGKITGKKRRSNPLDPLSTAYTAYKAVDDDNKKRARKKKKKRPAAKKRKTKKRSNKSRATKKRVNKRLPKKRTTAKGKLKKRANKKRPGASYQYWLMHYGSGRWEKIRGPFGTKTEAQDELKFAKKHFASAGGSKDFWLKREKVGTTANRKPRKPTKKKSSAKRRK